MIRIAVLILCTVPAFAQHWVALTWNATTGANGYHIYRGNTGGPYTTVGTSAGLTYSDSGVTAGSTYCYVITAYNDGGESPNSNEKCATIPSTPPPSGGTPPGGSAPNNGCAVTAEPVAVASTTLMHEVDKSEKTLLLTVGTGFCVPNAAKRTMGVFIAQEYMDKLGFHPLNPSQGLAGPTYVDVFRGAQGGYGAAHSTTDTVWYGPAEVFQINNPPNKPCLPNNQPLPWINTKTGAIYDCTNGVWVKR